MGILVLSTGEYHQLTLDALKGDYELGTKKLKMFTPSIFFSNLTKEQDMKEVSK
jgi:hypothetical protein